jgi:hypothetical protein
VRSAAANDPHITVHVAVQFPPIPDPHVTELHQLQQVDPTTQLHVDDHHGHQITSDHQAQNYPAQMVSSAFDSFETAYQNR